MEIATAYSPVSLLGSAIRARATAFLVITGHDYGRVASGIHVLDPGPLVRSTICFHAQRILRRILHRSNSRRPSLRRRREPLTCFTLHMPRSFAGMPGTCSVRQFRFKSEAATKENWPCQCISACVIYEGMLWSWSERYTK